MFVVVIVGMVVTMVMVVCVVMIVVVVTVVMMMVLVGGRMLMVYDLRVREHDAAFMTKPLRELGSDFHFVPVHWLGKAGLKALDLQEKLATGDRLTVIIALEDLQRLANLQRNPIPV